MIYLKKKVYNFSTETLTLKTKIESIAYSRHI